MDDTPQLATFRRRAGFGFAARLLKDRKLREPRQALFAPCLIAAKPVKPCDRGVFEAFYSLLKNERQA